MNALRRLGREAAPDLHEAAVTVGEVFAQLSLI
jgi:hypothetical protein